MMIQGDFILNNLIGKNVQLEPLAVHHYESLRSAANDERIWSYMPMKAYGDFFDQWFNDSILKHESYSQITYVVRCLLDQTIVGSSAYYDIEHSHKRLEVGYSWFTPRVWGTRFNHESLWLLFGQAFEQWQFNRIQMAADPNNKRSYNTLKKLGATEEGLFRQHMIHHHGRMTDTVIFSILASEWPLVKEHLWHRLYRSAPV